MTTPIAPMTVFNASLGREFGDIVHRSLTETGKLPAEFEDLLTVSVIEVNGQTRYIVDWA